MYDIYSGKITPGGTDVPGVLTQNECEKKCTDDPNCINYHYTPPGTCRLHRFIKTDSPELLTIMKREDRRTNPTEAERKMIKCCLQDPTAKDCGNFYPQEATCDSAMGEFCKNNPYHDACRCLSRESYHVYRTTKAKLPKPVPDECWYPHCSGSLINKSKTYVPGNMLPMEMTLNGKKYPDIKCITDYQAPIANIYDSYDVVKSVEGFSRSAKNINWPSLIIVILLVLFIFRYK